MIVLYLNLTTNNKYNKIGNPIADSIAIATRTFFSSSNINNKNLCLKIPTNPPKQFKIMPQCLMLQC